MPLKRMQFCTILWYIYFLIYIRDALIIGISHFADNRYRPITPLVLADCHLHSWYVLVFIYITKSKQI